MNINLSLNKKLQNYKTPSLNQFYYWTYFIFKDKHIQFIDIFIRIISIQDMYNINYKYRNIKAPTNVLTFQYNFNKNTQIPLLGDIFICGPIIIKEAKQNKKSTLYHWAHMFIHSGLHLLHYTHNNKKNETIMKNKEISILMKLNLSDNTIDEK